MIHVLAGSLGMSARVLASAQLFTPLKLIGAAYLVWIGYRTLRSARRDAAANAAGEGSVPSLGTARAFRDLVMVEALNPKTALFFLALIPHFVDPRGSIALQFLLLGFVSVGFNTLADVAVAFAANGIRAGAGARPALIRRLREGSGAGMLALGLCLVWRIGPRPDLASLDPGAMKDRTPSVADVSAVTSGQALRTSRQPSRRHPSGNRYP